MNSANILSSASILETLEKALPDPFFIIDSNGFYLEVLGGAENLLYDSVKYLKGKNLREVMSEENSDYFIDIINRAINEKKFRLLNTVFHRLTVSAIQWTGLLNLSGLKGGFIRSRVFPVKPEVRLSGLFLILLKGKKPKQKKMSS